MAEPPTIDLGSGHDLEVHEFKPHVGLCADGAEPVWDSLSPSLSAPHLLTHTCTLSLTQKKQIALKNKNTTGKEIVFAVSHCLKATYGMVVLAKYQGTLSHHPGGPVGQFIRSLVNIPWRKKKRMFQSQMVLGKPVPILLVRLGKQTNEKVLRSLELLHLA